MIGIALLLVAAAEPAVVAPPPATVALLPARFAPPIDRPMTYRVTTRRLARDGSMASYAIVYALRWDRVGRGVQLVATLQSVESDARPELAHMVAKLLQPLVGQPMTYLVAPDGSRIDLVDPDGLWQRVLGSAHDVGAGSGQPEARQMADVLASLPAAERDKLATSDIRALVAQAAALPLAGEGITVEQVGTLKTISKRQKAGAAGAQPLEIDLSWTVDTVTGLVMAERRQSWMGTATGGRTLVEERVRALDPAVSNGEVS